ncbi:MAG: hypothetical protein IT384_15125 [Deltaproteobacteria bacterium]|nr:hypothetical protein [Deltaproteobacteria bacterium]
MKRRAMLLLVLVPVISCATLLGLDRGRFRGFEHRAHVLQGMNCFKCHQGIADPGDEGRLHLPTSESCLECHPKPHDPAPCMNCHSSAGHAERLLTTKKHLAFRHEAHVPRLSANCARCHVAVTEDRTETPSMGVCLSCHGHQSSYDVRRCGTCHIDLPSEAVRPSTHIAHDVDFIQRHGSFAASDRDFCGACHAEKFCASCHGVNVPALESRRLFDRTERGANKLHRAGFRSRHSEEARAQPGTCVVCHAPSTCNDCHLRHDVAAKGQLTRGPHPASWVGLTSAENQHGRAARLDPVSCAACHSGAGEMLCVGCHKVGGVGGNVHPPGWSSNRPLTQAPCRLCHTGARP